MPCIFCCNVTIYYLLYFFYIFLWRKKKFIFVIWSFFFYQRIQEANQEQEGPIANLAWALVKMEFSASYLLPFYACFNILHHMAVLQSFIRIQTFIQ